MSRVPDSAGGSGETPSRVSYAAAAPCTFDACRTGGPWAGTEGVCHRVLAPRDRVGTAAGPPGAVPARWPGRAILAGQRKVHMILVLSGTMLAIAKRRGRVEAARPRCAASFRQVRRIIEGTLTAAGRICAVDGNHSRLPTCMTATRVAVASVWTSGRVGRPNCVTPFALPQARLGGHTSGCYQALLTDGPSAARLAHPAGRSVSYDPWSSGPASFWKSPDRSPVAQPPLWFACRCRFPRCPTVRL